MKATRIAVLGMAVVLNCSPSFAQHGHSGSATGHMNSMGGGNPHVMNTSANANASKSRGMSMDQRLAKNTQLSGKIQTLTGMTAQTACTGFKNLGQCVAAAHVSKNLNIPFACLKADMTGQPPATGTTCPAGTGTKAMSLGKSIQTLSPKADSKTESKKGEQQAQQDLKSDS